MIPVDSLLYKIDQKLNNLASNKHQQIQLEDKILALNEAQIKLIKQKVDGTYNGLGLDSFRKRYEDLQNLIENYDKSPLTLKLKDNNLNQFEASLEELSPKYFLYIDAYIIADKGRCKNRKLWINRGLTKHGDLQFMLDNSNLKPSFEYQETFSTLSSDNILVYTDGTFTPKEVYISYLRYPKYIDKEGYRNLKGEESVDQDSELSDYLEDELVDLTVRDLAGYIENASALQTAQLRIQSSE